MWLLWIFQGTNRNTDAQSFTACCFNIECLGVEQTGNNDSLNIITGIQLESVGFLKGSVSEWIWYISLKKRSIPVSCQFVRKFVPVMNTNWNLINVKWNLNCSLLASCLMLLTTCRETQWHILCSRNLPETKMSANLLFCCINLNNYRFFCFVGICSNHVWMN